MDHRASALHSISALRLRYDPVHTNAVHSGRPGRGRLRLTCGRGRAQHGGGFKDRGVVRGGALIRVVQRQAVGGQQEAGACGTAQQTQVIIDTLMCFPDAASQKNIPVMPAFLQMLTLKSSQA